MLVPSTGLNVLLRPMTLSAAILPCRFAGPHRKQSLFICYKAFDFYDVTNSENILIRGPKHFIDDNSALQRTPHLILVLGSKFEGSLLSLLQIQDSPHSKTTGYMVNKELVTGSLQLYYFDPNQGVL